MKIEITEKEREIILFAMHKVKERDEENYRCVLSKGCDDRTIEAYNRCVDDDVQIIMKLEDAKETTNED